MTFPRLAEDVKFILEVLENCRLQSATLQHSQVTNPPIHQSTMSYPTRSLTPHIRQPSMAAPTASSGQSPALVARVNEKKAELENLKELRDLSAAVASQMEALEQKLATLSDGTEGMVQAQVDWSQERGRFDSRANLINSHRTGHGQLAQRPPRDQHGFLSVFPLFSPLVASSLTTAAAKLPKPQPDAENGEAALPQTLVRIPTEHAPALQAQAEAVEDA